LFRGDLFNALLTIKIADITVVDRLKKANQKRYVHIWLLGIKKTKPSRIARPGSNHGQGKVLPNTIGEYIEAASNILPDSDQSVVKG